jgi:hypothetical protein
MKNTDSILENILEELKTIRKEVEDLKRKVHDPKLPRDYKASAWPLDIRCKDAG